MGAETGISWTDHTFNPWWGCFKVSQGCKHCYAEDIALRYGNDVWGPAATTSRRVFGQRHWDEPLKWNRKAQKAGVAARVFCASMSDVFEDHPQVVQEREKLWELIRETPWLHWLLLTKRPENVAAMLPKDWSVEHYPNVWLGVTCEDESTLWRMDVLRAIPAAVRFVSYEPAIGPIAHKLNLEDFQWLILGGESEPSGKSRKCDLQWATDVLALCRAHGVAFFFKQIHGRRSGIQPGALGRLYHEWPTPLEAELAA